VTEGVWLETGISWFSGRHGIDFVSIAVE